MAQISLSGLSKTLRDHRGVPAKPQAARGAGHRKDGAFGLLAALRYGVREQEAGYKSYGRPSEIQLLGRYAKLEAYRIGGRQYPAGQIHALLRQALEVDSLSPSQEARDLAHALRKGKNHEMYHLGISEIAFARPKLNWMLQELRS